MTAHAWTPTAYSMEERGFTFRVCRLPTGMWEWDISRSGIVEGHGERCDMVAAMRSAESARYFVPDPDSSEPRDPRDDGDKAYQEAVDNHEIPRAGEWDLGAPGREGT
jgi:hypothetical protein